MSASHIDIVVVAAGKTVRAGGNSSRPSGDKQAISASLCIYDSFCHVSFAEPAEAVIFGGFVSTPRVP